MKKNEALIFDLDGTITDTLHLSAIGSLHAVKEVTGKEVSLEDIKKYFGKSEERIFKAHCGPDWQKGMDSYTRFFEEKAGPSVVYPGMREVLEHLKSAGYKTAIVTGRGPVTTEIILRKTGLGRFFEHVKTGLPEANIKTQCMKEILNLWNQPPENTYYMGDIPRDVIDARAAGLTPLSAAWMRGIDKEGLQKENPLKIFDAVEDFSAWIKGGKSL